MDLKLIDLERLNQYDSLIKEFISSNTSDSIRINTTSAWNSDISYVPQKGQIIIYSDGSVKDGVSYPRFKVGDGNAFLIDLPFLSGELEAILNDHINNSSIHISAEERTKWNSHVSASYSGEDETLILQN